MNSKPGNNTAFLICLVVLSAAVTGYFVGMQSPMNPTEDSVRITLPDLANDFSSVENQVVDAETILATHYSNMHVATQARNTRWPTKLSDLKSTIDQLAEVKISPGQKELALAQRERNRAFNGAPPTIPHPVDQMSIQSCVACHGTGVKTETFRIPRMSHQFLSNCTQCHVENDANITSASEFRENSFVGLPAPMGGERAYEGAPPTIPHSTWMRVDCMSCHGFSGLQGIRTTHPWRQNCQQCHAPSSALDQIQLDGFQSFLPPIEIE